VVTVHPMPVAGRDIPATSCFCGRRKASAAEHGVIEGTMKSLLIGYLVIGFGISIYLLASRKPAKPGDTRWDMPIVMLPEIWVFAVALWPLYLVLRVLRERRRQPEGRMDRPTTEPGTAVGGDLAGTDRQ